MTESWKSLVFSFLIKLFKGRPSVEDVQAIQSPLAPSMLESLPKPIHKPKPLHELFPTASDEALDLLQKLLQFNPANRPSAAEALRHPFVSQFHNEDEGEYLV